MTTKTMTATIGPKIKTALPGPNAKRVLEGDEKYISPSYTRSYPDGRQERTRHCRDRRRRQRVFRFFRRHRRDLDRTLPSRCRRRHSEAGGRTDPHVGHRFLLREHGGPGRAAVEDRADARAAPIYYGNSGAEAIECALKLARYHTKRQNVIAFFGAFHGRTMGALSLTASKPQQKAAFRAAGAGRDARALSRCVSRMRGRHAGCGELRAGLRALHRRKAVQDHAALRKKWRRSLSSRSRAKADTWSLRQSSCRNCGASAIVTASCWWSTKCRAALDAPESGGPSSTRALSRTWSAWRRALLRACRWASP